MHLCIIVSQKRVLLGGAPYKSMKEGGGPLSNVTSFNNERVPMSCLYSNSMPLKQIIGQAIMYNGATSSFKIMAWWHTTLWKAPCHSEHSYLRYGWRLWLCFLNSTSTLHLQHKAHSVSAPGWEPIWINFDPTSKSKGWALFWGWALFHVTVVLKFNCWTTGSVPLHKYSEQ